MSTDIQNDRDRHSEIAQWKVSSPIFFPIQTKTAAQNNVPVLFNRLNHLV